MPWTFPAGPPMVGDSRRLALRVQVSDAEVTKALVFDALMTVGQACDQIRHQIREIYGLENPKDYGLFLPHDDNKKGLWLDNSRSLEHYILRNGDTIEYKYRLRWLYIRTMDGTRKTLRVDDSKTLSELMLPICTKMGIYNYEEYLLVHEIDEMERDKTLSMRRSHQGITGTLRDADKMDKLRKELRTDDDVTWLNPAQSLRQQGIDEKEVLLLRRRYFFSDMNVDARDPVQLNLLYVQLKDAIHNGTHPVNLEEAVHLAAIQCQVELGNHNPERFRIGYLDLKDFLPKEFQRVKNVEKKIFQQHATLNGLTDTDARVKYCHFCRSLKTYGITFFLVKEKMKGKNRLVPRLLGITKDSVVRLDERSKAVVKVWPLTSILKWAASPNAFTMDFGEYSPDEYYTAQTAEGEQISQLIAGYIDIILKKQKARDHQGLQGDEESAMYEENVRAERARIVQNERQSVGPADLERTLQVNDNLSTPISLTDGQRVEVSVNGHGYSGDGLNGYIGTTRRQGFIPLESPFSVEEQNTVFARRDPTDNFMTGGTHIYHYQSLTPVQRSLLVTIQENHETLEAGKTLLDMGIPTDRIHPSIGHDEASKRWLQESVGASKVKVADDVGAMNAAVAQAVRSANRADAVLSGGGPQSDPGDDLMMMQQSFRVVTVHFPTFVDDVQRVAHLRRESEVLRADEEEAGETREFLVKQSETNAQNLLGAARTVADSFSELLTAATPLASRQPDYDVELTQYSVEQQIPVGGSSRKAILEAANRVGEASNDFLRYVMQEEDGQSFGYDEYGNQITYRSLAEEERIYQDELLGLTKEVANATAMLVVKAKHLATQTNLDPEHQQSVVVAATQTGLCTSQLVACTKVLAPTIEQSSCQQQLSESAREVSYAVDGVVKAARSAGQSMNETMDDEFAAVNGAVSEVEYAATEVRNTLDQLNTHLLKESARPYQGDTLDLFQAAYDALQQETDGQRMVAAARRLSQITAQMIADVKTQAEGITNDADRQTHLFSAAKQLADATTDLINQAKNLSTNTESLENQIRLKQSADDLVVVAYASAAELLNKRVMRSLQAAARAVVNASNNLVTTSRCAAKNSRANNYQVLSDGKTVNDLMPKLVSAIQFIRREPEEPLARLELICISQQVIEPCSLLALSSKSMSPTVSDSGLQHTLDASVCQMVVAVETLRACLVRATPIARQLQMDGALARLLRTLREAEENENSARNGTLTALPDDKIENRFQLLSESVRDGTDSANQVASAVDNLVNVYATPPPHIASSQEEDWLGQSANQLASAMTSLVQSTRCIAASSQSDLELLQASRLASQLAYQLVCESRKCESFEVDVRSDDRAGLLANNAGVASKTRLYVDNLCIALDDCLQGLPGQRELCEASRLVDSRRKDLVRFEENPTVFEYNPNEASNECIQTEFTGAAVELNQATADLTSCYTPINFSKSSNRFAGAFDRLIHRGLFLSRSKPPQDSTGRELISGLVEVSDRSGAMLEDARELCSQPEVQPLRNRLHAAARSVTDSINHLLTISTSNPTPGLIDCDTALRSLEAMRPLLEYPGRPANQHAYHECVESVTQITAPLADGLSGIAKSVKYRDANEVGLQIRQTTDAVCQLIQETSQAAYLIGVSHPKSEPGRTGFVDRALFEKAQRDIQNACKAITSPQVTEREDRARVVNLANDISASLHTLCEACTLISSQATNPDARRQLKQMTNETMKSIKGLIERSADWSDQGRRATVNNAHIVNTQVSQLVRFVTAGSQFAGKPAKITAEARDSQHPICAAGIACLESGKGVILATKKMLQTNSDTVDDTAFIAYSAASRDASENTKRLLNVLTTQAPGQVECQKVLFNIGRLLHELEREKMAMMDHALQPCHETTEIGFQKQLASSVRAVLEMAPQVGRVASSEAEQLGHTVRQLDSLLPGILKNTLGAASRAYVSTGTQLAYIEHTRTLLESSEQLVQIAKEAGGNPRLVHLHGLIEDAVRAQIESCDDLLSALDSMTSQQDFISKLMAVLVESQNIVYQQGRSPPDAHFTDYQTRMLRLARHMQQQTQNAVLAARRPGSGDEMPPLIQNLAQDYAELCMICRDANETLPDGRQSDQLRSSVKNVGNATRGLIQSANGMTLVQERNQKALSPTLRNLDFSAGVMNDRLRELVALLEAQGPGTQACLQGASTVSGIIADLDTTILFASSGTLHPPIRDDVDMNNLQRRRDERFSLAIGSMDDLVKEEQDNFISIRESITRAADALVHDTRSLVNGAGEDQNQLVGSTQLTVRNISELADVVKQGASVLGPGQLDSQVNILGDAKAVAIALRNLLLTIAQSQGHPKDDPCYDDITSDLHRVEESVSQLKKFVNGIDTESTRGTKALVATIQLSRQLADRMQQPNAASVGDVSVNQLGSVSTLLSTSSLVSRYLAPEELSRAVVGPIQQVVAKAMFAGHSRKQDDALVAATTARHTIIDLVNACKNLQQQEIDRDTRQATTSAVKQVALQFAELLDGVKCNLTLKNAKDQLRMSNAAGRIVALSNQLLIIVEGLRGGPRLVLYFRANSPEWRDVAEKYLGRHVAFHNHYAGCHDHEKGSVDGVNSCKTSCLQMRLDSSGKVLSGKAASTEAERRIYDALQIIENDLYKTMNLPESNSKQQDRGRPILSMTRSVTLATRDFLEAIESADSEVKRGSGIPSEPVNLGHLKLSVSLANEHLCELARLCSESSPQGPTAAPVDDPSRVMPSRERLLTAVREVATASGELLRAVQSRPGASRITSPSLSSIKITGQTVKQQTDSMANMVMNGGPVFSHLPGSSGAEDRAPIHLPSHTTSHYPSNSSSSLNRDAMCSRAQIQTEKVALDDLEQQLANMKKQQEEVQENQEEKRE